MSRKRRGELVRYVGLALLLFFALAPLLWVGLSSIIPENAILAFPPSWFSRGLTDANYRYIITGEVPTSHEVTGQLRSMISQEVRRVPRAILNSSLIAGIVMLVNLIAGSLASYAYARLRFPGRALTFFYITLSRLIPPVALAVPYYIIVQQLGLLDSYWSLILIYAVLTLPFTILILTVYFRGIPNEVIEAARLDGCNEFQVLQKIMVPLALPSIIGAGLFSFMLAYSEFLFGLLIATTPRTRTLPVLLGSVSWNPDVTWSLLSASIVIGLLPTFLLIFPVWRYMVQGLTAGATR